MSKYTSTFNSELNRRVMFPNNWDVKNLSQIIRPTGSKEKRKELPDVFDIPNNTDYISIQKLIARLPEDYRSAEIITAGVSEVDCLDLQANGSSGIPILIVNNCIPTKDQIDSSLLIYMQYYLSKDNFSLDALYNSSDFTLDLLGKDIVGNIAYLLWRTQ